MVGRFLVLVASLVVVANDCIAVTPDELRALSADSDREQRASSSRAKANNLAPLVPSEKATESLAPRSSKYEGGSQDSFTSSNKAGSRQSSGFAGGAVGNNNGIMSDAVPIDVKRAFGIRLGTWMEGRVNRNTSSAEPGLVEIVLAADIIGDKKTLQAGTLFFARKQLNSATKRLELFVQKGIAPDGQEFKMTGIIFDPQKVSGLNGILTIDRDGIIKRGASKGLLAAAAGAAKSMSGSSPLGSAGSAGVDAVLQDENRIVDQTTEQKLTIYVAPQPVLIRVEETF